MASLVVASGRAGEAPKVEKNKKIGEKGSRFWMKLKFCFDCMSLGSKGKGSSRGKNKQDEQPDDAHQAKPRKNRARSRRSSSVPAETKMKHYSHLKQFTYHEMRVATRNFRREYFLGEGGFGAVFKGWINNHDGRNSPSRPGVGLPVAVKTLNTEGKQGHNEWVAEINHLGALQHPNLVKLIGYCIEDDQRLLVYEFMPRGSLEHHIFKRIASPLSWTLRLKIMLDAARGLAFLHEEAEKPLIYRDFKTSNILLDMDYNAKLSDFGLAKDAPVGDMTHVSTRVLGTQGYAAPEYVLTGHLTAQSDVYSFGVVLLEMLTGRRAMSKKRPPKEQNLVEWAKPYMRHKNGIYQLIDPRLEREFSPKAASRALRLVAHCIYFEQKRRPLMSYVVNVLSSIIDYDDRPTSPLVLSSPSPSPFHEGSSSYSNRDGFIVGSSSRSTPTRFQPSPINFTPPFRSPKT